MGEEKKPKMQTKQNPEKKFKNFSDMKHTENTDTPTLPQKFPLDKEDLNDSLGEKRGVGEEKKPKLQEKTPKMQNKRNTEKNFEKISDMKHTKLLPPSPGFSP